MTPRRLPAIVRSLALAGWAGAFAVLPPPADAAPSASEALRQGIARLENGEPQQAAELFEKAADRAPADTPARAQAWYNLGIARERLGRDDEAESAYREALKAEDPADLQGRTQYNLGRLLATRAAGLEEQRRLEPALEAANEAGRRFQSALRIHPGDPDAKANLELTRARQKRLRRLLEEQRQQQQQEQQQREDEGDREQQQHQPDSPQAGDEEQQQPSQQEPEPSEQDSEQERPMPSDSGDTPKEQSAFEKGEQEGDQKRAGTPSPQEPEQMTEEEARLLLEAMREEEEAQRREYKIRLGRPVPVEKDW